MLQRLMLAALLLSAARAASAAEPQFWRIQTAADALAGKLESTSVDSQGTLRLAPATTRLHDTQAPFVWALARGERGTLYAATGNEGRVFRLEGHTATVVYQAPELEVHALAVGPDGRLYAGSSPDGKVYAIDPNGLAEVFYDPPDRYVWALAFDAQGRLLVATGGEGRLYRVSRQGEAEVLLSTNETHLTALAATRDGHVYAGSAPNGIVYRIDPQGHVFVPLDSSYREVKALELGGDGSVYAALVEGVEATTSAPAPAPETPLVTSTEITVTATPADVPPATPPPALPAAPAPQGGARKGAVVRLHPGAEVETLWSSADERPHALALTSEGLLLGTGGQGKLYRLRDDGSWVMLASLPSEQVTALLPEDGGSVALATSNPGVVHRLERVLATQGTFTSAVKDAAAVARWGHLRLTATTPAGTTTSVRSRSGNTATPDATWSEWSEPRATLEAAVDSAAARFLQLELTLAGDGSATPAVEALDVAYLQRNLRPRVEEITVHPPGVVFQKPINVTAEAEILGLEHEVEPVPAAVQGPRPASSAGLAFGRKLFRRGLRTFSWRASDPNADALAYDIAYRAVGETRFRTVRRGFEDDVIAWDTTTLPNGRYVLRVTASDAPANPDPLALTAWRESTPFEVDNTPPLLELSWVAGAARVRGTARDADSLLAQLEYSVDGGRFEEVHPADGLCDAGEESFEFALPPREEPRPWRVVVRARDLLGNVATARVEVP